MAAMKTYLEEKIKMEEAEELKVIEQNESYLIKN